MKKTLLVAPTWWPVTLQEAKDQLKVLDSEEDELIMAYIKAATDFAEGHTWTEVVQKDYTIYMDNWEYKTILKLTPIQSIVSVKYYDSTNTLQTLSTSDYRTDLKADWPYILIDEMPTLYDKPNNIEIVVRTGQADVCNVNNTFKVAILMIVANLFNDRQDTNLLQVSKNNVPMTSLVLLNMVKNGKI